MKKIFTLCASALFVLGATAADPVRGLSFAAGSAGFDLGEASISNTLVSAPTSITGEAWVMYDEGLSGCTGYIMSNEGSDNGGFSLRFENAMEICIGTPNQDGSTGNAWTHCASDVSPEAGLWYHVAFTYDATALILKYYINGALVNTLPLSVGMNPSTKTLNIGEGAEWKGRGVKGSLSDVRLWSVVRTDAEIAADMTNSLTGTETGLLANWKMNECVGDAVADIAGNFSIVIPELEVENITWFGTAQSGVKKLASANVNAFVNGKSLNIANNSASTLNYAIYSVAGVKAFEGTAKAGASIAQKMNLSGVYFIKGVTVNGQTFSQKVVF